MYRTFLRPLLLTSLFFLFIAVGAPNVFGKKPPWAGGPENPRDYDPVSAPEPTTLSLIGIAIAGGAGYYFIRRKQKK